MFLWRFSLFHEAKLCKLLWQAFLWGRTMKHCAIKLCLDVYGIGLKMAIKIKVTNIHLTSFKRKKIFKVAGYCKKWHLSGSLLGRIRVSGFELDAVGMGCKFEIWEWMAIYRTIASTISCHPHVQNVSWAWNQTTTLLTNWREKITSATTSEKSTNFSQNGQKVGFRKNVRFPHEHDDSSRTDTEV